MVAPSVVQDCSVLPLFPTALCRPEWLSVPTLCPEPSRIVMMCCAFSIHTAIASLMTFKPLSCAASPSRQRASSVPCAWPPCQLLTACRDTGKHNTPQQRRQGSWKRCSVVVWGEGGGEDDAAWTVYWCFSDTCVHALHCVVSHYCLPQVHTILYCICLWCCGSSSALLLVPLPPNTQEQPIPPSLAVEKNQFVPEAPPEGWLVALHNMCILILRPSHSPPHMLI